MIKMKNPCTDLLKRPLQDLRISVIDRCNFRCKYCMPEDIYNKAFGFLKRSDLLSFEEITRLTVVLVKLGVRKVRITGGEPLLRPSLATLIHSLSQIPGLDDLGMITNGFLLPNYAQELKRAGLKRITVSLDSLDDLTFRKMNGGKSGVKRILEGIKIAEEAGFHSIKINAVIQRGMNDHNFLDLVRYFKGSRHIVRFIEYMDVGNINQWQSNEVVTANEILKEVHKVFPIERIEPNYPGEVASRYRIQDGSGEIGVISSVSKPFCGTCTRVRLSADGKLFNCLFANEGKDVKSYLRNEISDDDLVMLLQKNWRNRRDQYSQEREGAGSRQSKKVEMYHIGG
ncbi:MAG: cyclic pyranopterin phosphate synthase [Chlamydiales bacterium]|jgi:cyclic pyranopterin phosphate synthase